MVAETRESEVWKIMEMRIYGRQPVKHQILQARGRAQTGEREAQKTVPDRNSSTKSTEV